MSGAPCTKDLHECLVLEIPCLGPLLEVAELTVFKLIPLHPSDSSRAVIRVPEQYLPSLEPLRLP
eukprot:scaffold2869_cov408-Pavlova_lutheri.AAC.5